MHITHIFYHNNSILTSFLNKHLNINKIFICILTDVYINIYLYFTRNNVLSTYISRAIVQKENYYEILESEFIALLRLINN